MQKRKEKPNILIAASDTFCFLFNSVLFHFKKKKKKDNKTGGE